MPGLTCGSIATADRHRTGSSGLTHLGFYADGAIQPMIASIRAHFPSVSFTIEEAARRRADGQAELADLIEDPLGQGTRAAGESYGVLLLSTPDSPGTVHLSHPVINDILTENGRAWGWTLSQRYTSLSRLQGGVTKPASYEHAASLLPFTSCPAAIGNPRPSDRRSTT
jgi:hypothetical protein